MIRSLNILVIDENEGAEPALHELERASYALRVVRAESTPEIEAALRSGAFDLILLASRMNVSEALTLVRRHDPDVPLMILTDSEFEPVALALMHAGAVECFLRTDLLRLAPAVARELRHAELRAERSALAVRLRNAERRLLTTITQAPVGISHTDSSGRWVMVNDAMCLLLGYSEEEMLAMRFPDITHPDDLRRGTAARDAMLAGVSIVHHEKRYLRKDGSYVWANLTTSPVRDEAGNLEHFLAIVTDLTDHKASEEALRNSERKYRRLIETVHEGIWVIDSAGKTLFANSRLSTMLGYSAQELTRLDARSISPGATEIAVRIGPSLAEGSPSDEVRFLKSDGSELWALVSASNVETEESVLPAVLLTVLDITSRRRTEEELIKREIQLREAQQLALLGFWEFDLKTKRRKMSDDVAKMLGLPASEIATGFSSILKLVHPSDRAAVVAANAEAIQKLTPVDLDFRIIRPDGSLRVVYSVAQVLADGEGKATRIVGILQDITERRETKLALQRRAQQHATIAMLGQIALAGGDLDLLLRELTASLQEVMAADACDVLRREQNERFRYIAGGGWKRPLGELVVAGNKGSHSGFAIETGLAVVVEDFAKEDRFEVPDYIFESGVVSGMIVSIAGGEGGAFGTVGVYSDDAGHFGPDDLNFLRACANVIAEAVQRRKVEAALREQVTQQAAINKLAQRLLVTPISDRSVPVADLILSSLSVEYAAFLKLLPGGRELVITEGSVWTGDLGMRLPVDSTQSGYSITHNQPLIVHDYAAETRFDESRFTQSGIESGVTVPVAGKTTIFGALCAASRTANRFQRGDILFLEAIANLLAEGLERAETERELQESQSRYRDVVEGSPAIIGTLSPDRTILALNRAFEQITGWPAAEWVGHDFCELLAPRHQARVRQLFEEIVEGKILPPAEVKVLTRAGGGRVLEVSASPMTSAGQVVEIYCFGHDVTDRRRAESERLRLARELELILDAAGEGIYGVDVDGRCTMINRAAASMLGYAPEELLGKNAHEIIHSHPASTSAEGGCQIATSIRLGERIRVSDDIFTAHDGHPVPVEYSSSPIFDDGAVKGAVICFADTSARRKLENQLEQARRLTSLGKLAATVAHEFNNVLMGISPFTDLIRREVEGANKRLFDSTTHIQNALKRGKRITEEILRFTNPADPALAPLDVGEWLRTVESELRNILGNPNMVEIVPPPSRISVLGDASQLHQILTNLAMNARDAMPDGGRLHISARRPSPDETFSFGIVANADDYAHIKVRDDGVGIAPQVLAHVFEPLFTTKKAGTGLGLAVSHQVIKRHKGEIFVESALGRGTTFHLFIPLGVEAVPLPQLPPSEHPRLAGRHILLVEDDPIVAAGILAALEMEGLDVHHVSTGELGIRALQTLTLDAAILDVGLPDMEGTLVYEQGVLGGQIPVVFSTGHADRSKIAKYLVHKNVAYLLKPYSIDVLLDALSDILR